MIVDTHMHIFEDKYDGIREEVIAEAFAGGVGMMIAVGYDLASSRKALALARRYDGIYCAIGLHPSEAREENKDLSWIEQAVKSEEGKKDRKIVAIGEIGLDYYRGKENSEKQKEFFCRQMETASKLRLPVIIHSRNAAADCYDVIKAYPGVTGVFHCFGYSLETAKKFTEKGYCLGIGGVVTFANSKEIKRVVSGIDLKYLLSETDSPYMTPVPYRGHINRPVYTRYVVAKISEIKNIDFEETSSVLTANAVRLFKPKGMSESAE